MHFEFIQELDTPSVMDTDNLPGVRTVRTPFQSAPSDKGVQELHPLVALIDSDANNLLTHLLDATVTLGQDRLPATVRDLMRLAVGQVVHPLIAPALARATLEQVGMKVTSTHLLVSNTSRGLGRLLHRTPWADGWSAVLRRLPGAQCTDHVHRFAGRRSRGWALPLALVFGQGAAPVLPNRAQPSVPLSPARARAEQALGAGRISLYVFLDHCY